MKHKNKSIFKLFFINDDYTRLYSTGFFQMFNSLKNPKMTSPNRIQTFFTHYKFINKIFIKLKY